VLFSLAAGYHFMDEILVDRLVLIVTLSMALTPLALAHLRCLVAPAQEDAR